MKILKAIILCGLLMFCVINLESSHKTPNKLLYGYFLSKGTSMEPHLESPEVILIKPIPYEQVEVGDMVAFQLHRKSPIILHRVIKIQKSGDLVTKGDNDPKGKTIKTIKQKHYRGVGVQ
jgi:signal peptidase